MREGEMHTRRGARILIVLALAAAAALLAFVSPAAAAPSPAGGPVRFWSVDTVRQGGGEAKVAGGAQAAGVLHRVVDLGPSAFNFTVPGAFPGSDPSYKSPVDGRASAEVFSSDDGARYSVAAQAPILDHHRAGSSKGGVTHLDEYQAYVKRSGDASLRIKITDAEVQSIDGSLGPDSECLQIIRCFPIRSIVRFHARAYAASAGGDFFNAGGSAFVNGHFGAWDAKVATSGDSDVPLWTDDDFFQRSDCEAVFCSDPDAGITIGLFDRGYTLRIPLASVRTGELFGVHVSLEAEAVDDRGVESGAFAYLRDPPERGPALLQAHGLTPRGKPRFKEPAIAQPQPARCPAGTPRKAGAIQLSAPSFVASESSSDPLVLVTRTGGARGSASVTVSTHGGSARSGRDFGVTRTTIRFGAGDTSPRLVEIPIREDQIVESPESFTVSVGNPHCAKLGKQRNATVTILDDDQPPASTGGSPPTFTIGGAVDGLAGSGLVLVDQGTQVTVTGNGSFTFPGTFPSGSPYDVRVGAQPTNPDQVCTVVDGTGTVSADVNNVAIHCTNVATPNGLDASFGQGGRVSTPGGGDGRAVVVRSDGSIVVVGSRDDGVNGHTQFGAAGYDAAGHLDPSFGTGGIATSNLAGNDDKALGGALLPDGGFVAVGQADPAGLANTDFGIVRYSADGHPDPAFNGTGIEMTDLTGRDDVARAVAVQPDGKIVAAGIAETSPSNFDFALVRYNSDGTLDTSFGGDGIVTTDLGNFGDDANAIAIQSDGKIVAVGASGENIGLARYLPNGALDLTFGGTGTVVSNLGFDVVANGVAVTSGGTILVAGTRLGPHVNLDPYVASYGPDGKLNLGFGDFGVADTDLSGGDDSGDGIALDAAGGIVLVGSASSTTVRDMALVRYRLDGTLDTFLTTDFHGAGDFGHALAVDPLGGIVAAGTISNGESEFGLIRAFF